MNQQQLKTLLHYDPTTGVFRWRHTTKNGMQPWDVAGNIDRQGYVQIKIGGKVKMAHRLAWLYVHGELPPQVDHRNMNRSDNRIDNLREATNSQNSMNKTMQSNNTSGFKGVTFHRGTEKYHAKIQANGIRKSLGYFHTPEQAHQAYKTAAGELHEQFART
jgi:hypothetical protein